MKCPKCEYLSFESSDSCQNCGYEFSLSSPPLDAAALDLPLVSADTEPLIPSPDDQPHLRQSLDLDRLIGGPLDDLPLFQSSASGTAQRTAPLSGMNAADDDKPLITGPSRPRAPLGVRRATPEIPRARVAPRTPGGTLFEAPPAAVLGTRAPAHGGAGRLAAPASRIAAALVDGVILLLLDAAVLYFTLRLCNLLPADILELPAIPLVAFLLLLDGGYFVAFTAVGGQSIGKMALGIKVVGDEDRPVAFGRATVRTLAYVASALPFGAGFLPGVLGAERLALHDRLAHTRVVHPSSL